MTRSKPKESGDVKSTKAAKDARKNCARGKHVPKMFGHLRVCAVCSVRLD